MTATTSLRARGNPRWREFRTARRARGALYCAAAALLAGCGVAAAPPADARGDRVVALDEGGPDVPDALDVHATDAMGDGDGDGACRTPRLAATYVGRGLTWREIPFSDRVVGPNAFESMHYHAPTDTILVAGDCRFGALGSTYERFGLYQLDTANGRVLARRDVCFDTSIRAGGCGEAGGCDAGSRMYPLDDGTVILEADDGDGSFPRSPVRYRVARGSLDLAGITFFNDFGFAAADPPGRVVRVHPIAAGGNAMLGVEVFLAGAREVRTLSMYAAATMRRLGAWPVDPPDVVPVGALDSVWFGQRGVAGGDALNVYALPRAEEFGARPAQMPLESLRRPGVLFTAVLRDATRRSAGGILWTDGRLDRVDYATRPPRTRSISLVPGTAARNVALASGLVAVQFCSAGTCRIELRSEDPVVPPAIVPLPALLDGDSPRVVAMALTPAPALVVALTDSSNRNNGEIHVWRIERGCRDGP